MNGRKITMLSVDDGGQLPEGRGRLSSRRRDHVGELVGLTEGLQRPGELIEVLATRLGADEVTDRQGHQDAHSSSSSSASAWSRTRTSG